MKSVLHADDVLSGHCTDTTRVPAQKVHNYRSDRWITLKCFSGFSRDCFTWSSTESVLHYDDIPSRNSTDTTSVQAQKVLNYRSDRWIALKLFSGISCGCFTWSSVKSVLYADDVRSRYSTDTTRLPAPKFPHQSSDRWIALKFFQAFSEAVLRRVAWNWCTTPTTSVRAMPATRPQYWHKRSITIDPTVGLL